MQNVKVGKYIDDEGQAINDVEKILAQFDIRLRDTNKEWRNMGDVINELGGRWQEFTSVEKDAISTAVAGKKLPEHIVIYGYRNISVLT